MTYRTCAAVVATLLSVSCSPFAKARTCPSERMFHSSSSTNSVQGRWEKSEALPAGPVPLRLNAVGSSGNKDTELDLFGNFGDNILSSFKGNNLYLHLTAVASTCILVAGDVDYAVEHFFNTNPQYGEYGRGVFVTGQYLPFIVGGSLLMYSGAAHNKETLGAAFAVIQASIIELMYNTALKAFTGRPGPDWRHHTDMESLSKTFRFGFLRGGVFWGWPSGHTATTTAVVSSLMGYYPHSTWLKVAGLGLIAYTIFAVTSVNGGGMHWLSDAVAAALMSYAVGSTVGKYYRNVYGRQAARGAVPTTMSAFSLQASPMTVGFSFHF